MQLLQWHKNKLWLYSVSKIETFDTSYSSIALYNVYLYVLSTRDSVGHIILCDLTGHDQTWIHLRTFYVFFLLSYTPLLILSDANATIYHDGRNEILKMFNVRTRAHTYCCNPLTFKLWVSFEWHLNIDQSTQAPNNSRRTQFCKYNRYLLVVGCTAICYIID